MTIAPNPQPAISRSATPARRKVDLRDLLESAEASVAECIERKPEVVDAADDFDAWDDTYIKSPKWVRLVDAVAVVVDLKNSTQLGLNKHAASTASIYDAGTGNAVRILDGFGTDFIAIQGDGAVALFWGDHRYERAFCAAVSVKTFSEKTLVPLLVKKWPEGLPETGFKVGMAASPLLVKRIGVAGSAHQEPVWPGRAVNYATKAAQAAAPGQLIVTDTVWEKLETNEYISYTCGCGSGATHTLWDDFEIDKLPEDEDDRYGRVLTSNWCDVHGVEFCDAILAGKRARDDVREQAKTARREAMQRYLEAKENRPRNLRGRR